MPITKEFTLERILNDLSFYDNNDKLYSIYKNTEQETPILLKSFLDDDIPYFGSEKDQEEHRNTEKQHFKNLEQFTAEDYKAIKIKAENQIKDYKYKECIELLKENETLRKTIDLQSKLPNKFDVSKIGQMRDTAQTQVKKFKM